MEGWLGVIKAINSSKLARVTIDYPNSADKLWSLDITKTMQLSRTNLEKKLKS